MDVRLPFQIGTMLVHKDKKQCTKLHHYIIGDETNAVLERSHAIHGDEVLYSSPGSFITITLEKLCEEWQEKK